MTGCWKVPYSSRAAAIATGTSPMMRRRNGRIMKQLGKPQAYKCTDCGSWHWTNDANKAARDIRSRAKRFRAPQQGGKG